MTFNGQFASLFVEWREKSPFLLTHPLLVSSTWHSYIRLFSHDLDFTGSNTDTGLIRINFMKELFGNLLISRASLEDLLQRFELLLIYTRMVSPHPDIRAPKKVEVFSHSVSRGTTGPRSSSFTQVT